MPTRLFALFAVFAVSTTLVLAQPAAYPTKPIRIVVA